LSVVVVVVVSPLLLLLLLLLLVSPLVSLLVSACAPGRRCPGTHQNISQCHMSPREGRQVRLAGWR